MRAFQAYLHFDGNTREAMTFYQKCVDGELFMQSFADAKLEAPKGGEQRIIHARLTKGSAVVMASDTMPGTPFKQGNNFFVNIDCENVPEIEKLFKAFSDGGKIIMPLQDTFWNARFGMLTDRFGVQWMFNCDLAKKA